MTDGHYDGYQEMLSKVNWEKYGVVDGVARDTRCENCMVHCGYDPSGALGTNYQRGDNWKNMKYNFGAKPKPFPASEVLTKRAFNGVSIGQGHLAQAKAAINSPRAAMNGAQAAFSRKVEEPHEAHVLLATAVDQLTLVHAHVSLTPSVGASPLKAGMHASGDAALRRCRRAIAPTAQLYRTRYGSPSPARVAER